MKWQEMNLGRPDPSEHHPYFSTYIDLVSETDILHVLNEQVGELEQLLGDVDEATAVTIHAPYSWTLVQMLGHCVDTERVFGYRIARFGAGDSTPLVGFDQDQMVADTDYQHVTLRQLLDEFRDLRQSNLAMLKRFTKEMWQRSGTADGSPLSVLAGAFILAGHIRHHQKIARIRLGA